MSCAGEGEPFQLFAEEVRAWPAVFEVVNAFFGWRFYVGPVLWADADGAAGAESFQNQWDFELNLDSAAAEFGCAFEFFYRGDFAVHAIVIWPPSAQGGFCGGHFSADAGLKSA